MILRRKPKNRRIASANVLEVKIRSKHVRAARVRRFGGWLAWAFGSALLGVSAWYGSQWALEEFVFRNPTFGIRRVAVQTDGILPTQRLQLWTGVQKGDNLFGVDIQRVRRDLKLNSLIREAAVDRVLPDTLWVRVTEREPVAQFTAWQQSAPGASFTPVKFFLDDQGYLLQASDLPKLSPELSQQFDDLPELIGVNLAEVTKDQAIGATPIQAALRFVAAFNLSPMSSLVDLRQIDLSSPQVLHVNTRQNHSVTFGYSGHAGQLRRWRAVHEFATNGDLAIATLDLSVSNNVPVRWQEVGFTPPARPKNAKTFRYKKRNV